MLGSKQKLIIRPTSIQRWIPTPDCRRTVEMITICCLGTTPVSNVLPILLTNKYWLYTVIIVLRVKTYFEEDYQCRINFVQTLVFYSVNYKSRLDNRCTLHIRCRKITFPTVGISLGRLYTQRCTNTGVLHSTNQG